MRVSFHHLELFKIYLIYVVKMIEIKAKLVRADAAIYATGERVECLIEFLNKIFNNERDSSVNIVECLAWASVQLHCYRKTNLSVGTTDKNSDLVEMIGKTALDAVTQAPGDVIIATKPKILFCDLKLQPGESKVYFFNEIVPREGPPTYRGHNIKYFYKLTIATQRVRSKVQTLAVPIRVLPIPLMTRQDEVPITEETNDELAPTNPFLEKKHITELEISWHHLKNITARRTPKFYRISNKRGFVGRFCLFKPSYKLGEDIVGSLDYTNCQVRCIQFSVKLQSQEIFMNSTGNISVEFNDVSSTNSIDMASIASGATVDFVQKATTSSANSKDKDVGPIGKITTHAVNHEVCYAVLQTQVVVPIPLHITPTFRTESVEVKWRLHFEFVTSTMMNFKTADFEGELQAPNELPVETMIWDLPITIYAANPLQIYAPSQGHSILIK